MAALTPSQSIFQTIVHTPHGIHMMGAQGMMGPALTSAAQLPVRPVTAHQPTKYQVMDGCMDT